MVFLSNSTNAYEFKAHFRHVPPDMTYIDNVPAGPIREIIDLAVTHAGHTVVWKTVPWKRTQKVALQGKTDLLVRHSMNGERQRYLSPIINGHQIREVIFITAPNIKVVIDSFEDLQKYTIGQHRGYLYAPQFDQADNLKREIANEHRQLVQMLKRGRVDAVVMTTDLKGDIELLLAVEGAKISTYRMLFANKRFCSIPVNSPAIAYFDQISTEIFKLRRSGEMSDIMKKHGAEPYLQDFTTPESKAQEALIN